MNYDKSKTIKALDVANSITMRNQEADVDPFYQPLYDIARDTIDQATEAGADFDTADQLANVLVFGLIARICGRDPEPLLEEGRKLMESKGIDFPLMITDIEPDEVDDE